MVALVVEVKLSHVDYFIAELPEHHPHWDGLIKFSSIPGKLDWKQLTEPLPCGTGLIPTQFEWDGSSSGVFGFLIPKWRHPIMSCRHDYRNLLIRRLLKAEVIDWKEAQRLRKISDVLAKQDTYIGQTSKIRGAFEANVLYSGVRIGALLRIGMRPKK